MTVPYTFASASTPLPLAELDTNFATPITIGSTPVILGGTYTEIDGLTLGGATLNTSTLNSPTMVTPALGTPASGNLTNCSGYTYANLAGTVPTWNQNTTGNAATATSATIATTATNIASGATQQIPMQIAAGTTTFMPTNFGFKNRIINGAMGIDQRDSGASVTPISGQYTLDRWQSIWTQASKYSVQQNAGSITPPAGFVNYLGVTSLSSYTSLSTDFFFQHQPIEGVNVQDLGWGTTNAKTVTLSFWVYSSLTGTFSGSLQNNGENRSYPFTYTVSSANTWTQISVTVPGDTTGSWYTNTNIGVRVNFNLGSGSSYLGTAGSWSGGDYKGATSSVSIVGTSGATFYFTGVQFEIGSVASSFDVRPFTIELDLCLRYAYQINSPNPGSGNCWDSVYTGAIGQCLAGGTMDTRMVLPTPVPMRATPSLSYANTYIFGAGSFQASTSPAVGQLTLGGVKINTPATGVTTGSTYQLTFSGSATGYLLLSAEL